MACSRRSTAQPWLAALCTVAAAVAGAGLCMRCSSRHGWAAACRWWPGAPALLAVPLPGIQRPQHCPPEPGARAWVATPRNSARVVSLARRAGGSAGRAGGQRAAAAGRHGRHHRRAGGRPGPGGWQRWRCCRTCAAAAVAAPVNGQGWPKAPSPDAQPFANRQRSGGCWRCILVNGIASAVPATLVLFFIRGPAAGTRVRGAVPGAATSAPACCRCRCGWRLVEALRPGARVGLAGMLLAVAAFALGRIALGSGRTWRASWWVCVASGMALGADLSPARRAAGRRHPAQPAMAGGFEGALLRLVELRHQAQPGAGRRRGAAAARCLLGYTARQPQADERPDAR